MPFCGLSCAILLRGGVEGPQWASGAEHLPSMHKAQASIERKYKAREVLKRAYCSSPVPVS